MRRFWNLLAAVLLVWPCAVCAHSATGHGIVVKDELPRRAGPLGLRFELHESGVLRITQVQPGLPADRAGIRPGDLLLTINGESVRTPDDAGAILRRSKSGDELELRVQREDQNDLAVRFVLEPATEVVEGSVVRYDHVVTAGGYRLRTIVTEPLESPRTIDGLLPAFLFVQGIICDTIDRPHFPEAPDTRIVHAMAKAGFVTMRVDKPGTGDSEGPACSEIDFSTELDGFASALRALASMPNVDPNRIYVFGHSMGGVMAPYLAAELPVRGSIVYGTLVRTWFEYQLENVRRQSELRGFADELVNAYVQAEAKRSSVVLIEKGTLGDAWDRWPELRQPTQGIMLDEEHMSTRHVRFFHELQDLNLAQAWADASGHVLAIWGEYDWVCAKEDHDRIAAIVNRREAGAGSSITLAQADHSFTTHPNLQASLMLMGRGRWADELIGTVLEWIDGVESTGSDTLDRP